MVYRIFVEKKAELAHEAKSLCSELVNLLGIKNLTSVRVLNRYDADNITEEIFDKAVSSVFSEPQLDVVSSELDDQGGYVFAVEYLPGQFDQRADSAAQCKLSGRLGKNSTLISSSSKSSISLDIIGKVSISSSFSISIPKSFKS